MTRVLVVEDSATQAQEIELILEAEGYDVAQAPDGETALDLLERQSFDIVLSDVQMPGISGYDLCRSIKSNPRLSGLPVILLTRPRTPADIVRGLECGADDFQAKPYEADRLSARIDGLVARPPAIADERELATVGFEFMDNTFEIAADRSRILSFLTSTFEEYGRAQQRELATQLETETQRRRELAALTSELRDTNEKLIRLARVDPLTELLNRRGIEEALAVETTRARRMDGHVVAGLVDLDGFKRVNDLLGHAVGDVALVEISKRLLASLRPSDCLGRLGGDEFLMLLTHTSWEEALKVADRVRLVVAQSPIVVFAEQIRITASIGAVLLPDSTCSIEEVLSLTRTALHDAKLGGGNRVAIAPETTINRESGASDEGAGSGAAERHYQSIMEIKRLLHSGAPLRTVAQPIFGLGDENLAGYEMLSRGPAGPFEMPNDFFRLCLEGNFLTVADLNCLRSCVTACAQLTPGRFHVNLFPSTLLDTPAESLIGLLAPDGSSTFCVEISEQQFLSDPTCLRGQVEALRAAGVLIAMDDVGFGRSSLESLVQLEPDIIKIDPKYVRGVSGNREMARSIGRLLKIAESLDAETVAEGIEEREDLHVLRDLGVGYGQGYFWGVPA